MIVVADMNSLHFSSLTFFWVTFSLVNISLIFYIKNHKKILIWTIFINDPRELVLKNVQNSMDDGCNLFVVDVNNHSHIYNWNSDLNDISLIKKMQNKCVVCRSSLKFLMILSTNPRCTTYEDGPPSSTYKTISSPFYALG